MIRKLLSTAILTLSLYAILVIVVGTLIYTEKPKEELYEMNEFPIMGVIKEGVDTTNGIILNLLKGI